MWKEHPWLQMPIEVGLHQGGDLPFTTQELERKSYSNITEVWSLDSSAHLCDVVLFQQELDRLERETL